MNHAASSHLCILAGFLLSMQTASTSAQESQSETPLIAPRKGSTQILQAFNGRNLSGWDGQSTHWTVENGEIVGRSTEPLAVSTYLISQRSFRDFRLTFEFKLAQSEMHSGIAFWGTPAPEQDDTFSCTGHLVMFPSQYGFYDLDGRKLIHENAKLAIPAGRQHDWNRIEILAQGNRIRFVLNGKLISDWREPLPETVRNGPIGLQLHSNKEPQEVRFRKLRIETFPVDHLTTLDQPVQKQAAGIRELVRAVDPATPQRWTSVHEAVIPDELLAATRTAGLKTMGILPSERDSYYAFIQKADETDVRLLHRASVEFRNFRSQSADNIKWRNTPADRFPSFVDLYHHPEVYHGKLLTVHGHIRKLVKVPLDKNPYGLKQIYEAWLYDLNAQGHPTVILTTSIDPRLTTGTEVEIDHCFATGYFFKNLGYKAQDSSRYAPLLMAGKLEYLPADEAGQFFRLDRSTVLQLLFGTFLLLMIGRHLWQLRWQAHVEETQRLAVRGIVDQQHPEPAFDNIHDQGATPDFSALGETDSAPPAEPE
ncbi:MAG: DUF1080 domain-containing protein, partial [Planctomycetaceae bacterium]